MILRKFIKRCETGYNSISIVEQNSGNGYYFESLADIPEDFGCCKIVQFDSGFGYDKLNGMIYGLYILVRKLPDIERW